MPSRDAILALLSVASCSSSWRHECANRNGCTRGSGAEDCSSLVGEKYSRMRVGKGSGWTTKGVAPHREKGMPTVKVSSQKVRDLALPAEPSSVEIRTSGFTSLSPVTTIRCEAGFLWKTAKSSEPRPRGQSDSDPNSNYSGAHPGTQRDSPSLCRPCYTCHVETIEQTTNPPLARRLGDTAHVSPLLHGICQMSGCSEARVGEWLLKCAVGRGASHYERDFPADLPPDYPELSDEELGVALCLGEPP
jgi:hypothetical protein